MNEDTVETSGKLCLECGEPLGPGRGDRKFCNDACRTAFNNKRRKEPPPIAAQVNNESDWRTGFYIKINTIINYNRAILEYLCEIDMRSIKKHDLEGYGFNFKYFSSEYNDPEQGLYRFCYDHGYRIYNENNIHILVRTEEILC